MKTFELTIRLLQARDIPQVAKVIEELGWNKPVSEYQRRRMEEEAGSRMVYVALLNDEFAGYLTICWHSHYAPFHENNIPEIVDFAVLPRFRRMGIGSRLMETAEHDIAKVSPAAGIAVGLTRDYGAAQRLYFRRGYIPDGLGLHWRDHHTQYGEQVIVDDDLALYLKKDLK